MRRSPAQAFASSCHTALADPPVLACSSFDPFPVRAVVIRALVGLASKARCSTSAGRRTPRLPAQEAGVEAAHGTFGQPGALGFLGNRGVGLRARQGLGAWT